MQRWIFILLLSVSLHAVAETTAMELRHANGDVLTIQRLDNGEVWGSFFLSDRLIASFASHELIVLQVDGYKPVKLEQGLRSCGAPAPKAQQVVYQFEQQEQEYAFSGSTAPKTDVLKLLGWDQDQYNKLSADRRPEVVDFPISRDDELASQLAGAGQISFRYVTDSGEQRETVFHLAPHQHILEQLVP